MSCWMTTRDIISGQLVSGMTDQIMRSNDDITEIFQ